MVQNIGELVTKVLPHSFETPFGGEGTRERIQDIMKYNRKILEEMGREPTFPPPRKGPGATGGNQGLRKSVCGKGFLLLELKYERKLITNFPETIY